jgi:hypothetical protein
MCRWLGIALRIARECGGNEGSVEALRCGKALRIVRLMVEDVRRFCW